MRPGWLAPAAHTVRTPHGTYRFGLRASPGALGDAGAASGRPCVVFLHGFLGDGRDWEPVMAGLAGSHRVVAVDLPGHGASAVAAARGPAEAFGVPAVAEALCQLLAALRLEGAVCVGYSMGARLALKLAAHHGPVVRSAVCVSGSPGLRSAAARAARAERDAALARALEEGGAEPFVAAWYQQPLFAPLRRSPGFATVLARRAAGQDAEGLAAALAWGSVGRQPSLWEDLPFCRAEVLAVAGAEDPKYVALAEEMAAVLAVEAEVVPGAGHAVHLERPAALVAVLQRHLEGVTG